MSRPTPEPWTTEPGTSAIRMNGRLVAISYPNMAYDHTAPLQHRVRRLPPVPRQERDANAQLMTAAPKMLAALKAIVEHRRDYRDEFTVLTALAAIAEAEGRTA